MCKKGLKGVTAATVAAAVCSRRDGRAGRGTHHTCGRYPFKGLEETEQMSKRDEDSGVLSVSAESQPETQSERCAAKGGRGPESEPLPVVASGRLPNLKPIP